MIRNLWSHSLINLVQLTVLLYWARLLWPLCLKKTNFYGHKMLHYVVWVTEVVNEFHIKIVFSLLWPKAPRNWRISYQDCFTLLWPNATRKRIHLRAPIFIMWTEITHLKVCIIISMAGGSDSLLWYMATTHWSLTIGYKSLLMYVARDAIGYCGPWPQQPEVSRLAIIIFIATACGFFLQ